MKYKTGEEIRKGDRILFHSEPGQVEFVLEQISGDPAMDWYIEEQGPGAMVLEPKFFGRVFVSDPQNVSDLEFVSRT